MICVSVTLGVDVPPRDRVEMQAAGAAAFDFPVEDVTIDVDGVRQPKSHVEVSAKRDVGEGELTIVNKSRQTWVKGVTITACWPGPDTPPIGVGVIALLTGEATTIDFGQVDAIGESAEIGLAIGQQMDAAAGTVTVTSISNALVDVSSAALTALQGGLSVLAGGSVSVGVSSASLALSLGAPFIWARIPSLLTLTGVGMTTTAGTISSVPSTRAAAPVSIKKKDEMKISAGTVSVTTTIVAVPPPISVSVAVAGQSMTASAGTVTVNATVGSSAVFYPATGLPAPVTQIAVSLTGYTAGTGYAVNSLSPHGTNPVGTCFSRTYWTSPSTATKYLTATVVSNFLFAGTFYSRDQSVTGYCRNGEVFLRLTGGRGWAFRFNFEGAGNLSIGLCDGLAEGVTSPVVNSADATYFAGGTSTLNADITALIPTYNASATNNHRVKCEASGLDLIFWFAVDGVTFVEIMRLSAPDYATWLHMTPGAAAIAAIGGDYGWRAFTIDYDDSPAAFLSDFVTTLHLADLGVKDVQTTGSVSAASADLTVADASGFVVGDNVIVDTTGTVSAGALGSIGPGGAWPALRYADAPAMNADSSKPANTVCSLSSTGYVYQYIGGVWTQVLVSEPNLLYNHKSLPLALRARIIHIAGSVLTLDATPQVAVTASGVFHDNEPIIGTATNNTNYQVSVPALKIVFPDGDVVIGEPLQIYGHAGWSVVGQGSGIANSEPDGLTRLWAPRGCPAASLLVRNNCVEARDIFVDGGAYVLHPQVGTHAMSQTSTVVDFPYGFGLNRCEDVVVTNIRTADPWQKAVGLIDCSNVAVSACICEKTDPLLRYVQWMFQSSGSAAWGGGNTFTDCEMSADWLTTFCEPFADDGTQYIRCVARNGYSSNNSSINTVYTDHALLVEANTRYSAISMGIGQPIIQTNGNFSPGISSTVHWDRFRYKLEGYVDANDEQPKGIVISSGDGSVVTGATIEMLTYSATSTGSGAVGIDCNSDATIDDSRVDGTTVSAFQGNISAYGAPNAVAINNCIADRVVNTSGTPSGSGNVTTTVAGTDRTPGAIAFTDVTGATPGQTYTSNEITISGVNALLRDVTLTPGARFIWNGSGLVRNHDHWMLKLLKNGDRIKLVAEAPATVTLQLASGHTTDWVLST